MAAMLDLVYGVLLEEGGAACAVTAEELRGRVCSWLCVQLEELVYFCEAVYSFGVVRGVCWRKRGGSSRAVVSVPRQRRPTDDCS